MVNAKRNNYLSLLNGASFRFLLSAACCTIGSPCIWASLIPDLTTITYNSASPTFHFGGEDGTSRLLWTDLWDSSVNLIPGADYSVDEVVTYSDSAFTGGLRELIEENISDSTMSEITIGLGFTTREGNSGTSSLGWSIYSRESSGNAPVLRITTGNSLILNALLLEDTYISSDISEFDTNFASSNTLKLRTHSSTWRNPLIQFELPTVPAGDSVAQVDLILRSASNTTGVGGTPNIEIRLIDNSVGGVSFVDQTASFLPNALGKNFAAIGDTNNDGRPDLFANGQVWTNLGGTSFGLSQLGYDGRIVLADYNNDGFQDALGFKSGEFGLFHNDGGTGFTRVDASLPTMPMSSTIGAVWADFDNDTFVDLYVGGFESTTNTYQPDAVLKNNGGTSFSINWQQTGDIDPARGVTAADFDRDGDVDVYVSNYRLEANLLMVNDGNGNFENKAAARGVEGHFNSSNISYGHTIGSAWGDLDNDGYLDLFVGNFSHPAAYQDRSKFYRNKGPEGGFEFEDMSASAGLDWQESFATPTLGDYDNDGDLDLFFTTVYTGGHSVLYSNNGDWTFSDVTSHVGLRVDALDSVINYQAAWADINDDGFLDLVSGGRIYVNQGNSNHWMKVKLFGDGSTINRDAIGAQVFVYREGEDVVMRQVETSTGQGNQNDMTLHFGLSDYEGLVDLMIFWPNGDIDHLSGFSLDQTLELYYGVAGDFNRDGFVDGSDFTKWQRDPNVGRLADWQANIGNQSLDATATHVPEPSGGLILAFGLFTMSVGARRFKRQR
ncbi:CRTAC1 family protein [Adhaeretor mobilis]|nr:CRTAC1 family protein [Adhaeretor mobilis]